MILALFQTGGDDIPGISRKVYKVNQPSLKIANVNQ